MKTESEITDLRQKLDTEIRKQEMIIYRMRERIEVPQESANVGFENYLMILINRKVLCELQRDTLDWVLGLIGE